MSGDVIPEGTGARIRIMFNDPTRTDMRADLTDSEALALAKKYKAEEVETRPERRVARVG